MTGRRTNEKPLANEARPEQVKKGDLIELVSPWNFHRHYKRTNDTVGDICDIYTVDVWTVAAIGKKIMRLVRDGDTLKANVWTTHQLADGSNGFQAYIATLGNGNALAHEMHRTDEAKTFETCAVMSTEKAKIASGI